MIKKILIANRGEIALRIMRTCKKHGIKTVAIYSEADKNALFVKEADESILIGPPPVQESYLQAKKIIEVAKEVKADAIHPGYGLLSENSEFVKLCEENNLIFIGPSADLIDKMGNKIIARNMMERLGLPIIPGTDDVLPNIESAVNFANQVGYPLMLKATAGGGGIGMEIVHSEQELVSAFESNSRRAEQFFGNPAMYIEKVIENARHIEIQVVADCHGNAIHLYERECSIQRRNQKVIEEAPSSFVSEMTRQKMGDISVKAIKEIGYSNVGTIEYLVDKDENFFFLEMNTRIQVEHAITEQITGIDIVKLQIDIANGNLLPISQDEVEIKGHAIEARIYAEDPVSFFPSPGRIDSYHEPSSKSIRIESSVSEGDLVTPFYDPMISKLIVTGENRSTAIEELNKALDNYKISGIKTNIPMLKRIMKEMHFINGNITTDYVKNYYQKK